MKKEPWMFDSKGQPSKQTILLVSGAKHAFKDKYGRVRGRKLLEQWIADFAKKKYDSESRNSLCSAFYETCMFCDFLNEEFHSGHFKVCEESFRYLEAAWEDYKIKTNFYQALLDEVEGFYSAPPARSGEIEDETSPPNNVFWLHTKNADHES